MRTTVRTATLSLLLLGCTACADLSAVAKFAASAKNASTGFSAIANDLAGSATRRAAYVHPDDRAEVLKQADAYRALKPDMLAAQKVLVDYISALAAIATDSKTSRDASIKATQDGLKKIGLTVAQASAGVGLETAMVEALAAGYRSNKAGKAIRDCNAYLQDYLVGLEHIAGTNYPQQLDIEQVSAEGHYDELLHFYAEKEPLAAVTTREQLQQHLDQLATKREAAAAYVKILTDIGEGHQKLYDAGARRNPKELAALVGPYVDDIAKQSEAVAKAF